MVEELRIMSPERPFTWRIGLRWIGTTTLTMALLGMVSAVSTAVFSPNGYSLTIIVSFLKKGTARAG
jgi:hypothetical protein